MQRQIPYWNDLNATGEPNAVTLTKSSRQTAIPVKRCRSGTLSQSIMNKSMEMNSPENSCSPKSYTLNDSPLLKNKALHSSMENLRKPRNHRSDSLLRESASQANKQCAMEAQNKALAEENFLLMSILEDNRKKTLVLKVCIALTHAAIARRGKNIEDLEGKIKLKREECAARLILHHLLLNSWRNKKADLERATEENFQLGKTVSIFFYWF